MAKASNKITCGPIGGVALLQRGSQPCINIMFYPSNVNTIAYMTSFAQQNAARTNSEPFAIDGEVSSIPKGLILDLKHGGDGADLGIVSIPSESFMYNFIVANQNVTNWGIIFNETTLPFRNIQYQIWFNSSRISNDEDIFSVQMLSLMRGIDEAICTLCLKI